jgi:hypothetical protein
MRYFKDLGGNSYSTQDKQNFCPYFKDQYMEGYMSGDYFSPVHSMTPVQP